MPSKLETLMSHREANEKALTESIRNRDNAIALRDKAARKRWERSEFTKRFVKLIGLVEGDWDKYGHGWKFNYRDCEYYVSYDDYHYDKEPGDVDSYAVSGSHWVLKKTHNGAEVYLSNRDTSTNDLTDAVLNGLKELNRK